MGKVIITALLTSLIWACVLVVYEEFYLSKLGETVNVEERVELPENDFVPEEVEVDLPQSPKVPKRSQQSSQKNTQQVQAKSQSTSSANSATTKKKFDKKLFGKWYPVEGAKSSIEISRYGTFIEWWAEGHCSRYDFNTNGDAIAIDYDRDGRYALLYEGNSLFLEIFNNEKFSGKYIKVSSHPSPAGDKVDIELYPTKILGKWQPYVAAKHPIEISKYGTLIEWWAQNHSSRYQYTLKGDRMDVDYERGIRVKLTQNETYVYLELYNSDKFSGCYRRKRI